MLAVTGGSALVPTLATHTLTLVTTTTTGRCTVHSKPVLVLYIYTLHAHRRHQDTACRC